MNNRLSLGNSTAVSSRREYCFSRKSIKTLSSTRSPIDLVKWMDLIVRDSSLVGKKGNVILRDSLEMRASFLDGKMMLCFS